MDEFHYGWMLPNSDEAGSYAFRIEGTALPADVWEECERTLNFFSRVRPFLISYVVLDSYFGDLLKIPQFVRSRVGNNPAFLHRVSGISVQLHATCDKAVNGFLAAGQAFRDRLVTKLALGPSSDHPVRECIRQLETQHAIYRLLMQLRNLGLHNEAVFRAIPVKVDADGRSYEVELRLNKRDLLSRLSRSKLQAVGDTTPIPDNIDFLDAARVYIECNRTILSKLLEIQADELAFSVGFMRALRSGARQTPKNAIPLIFRGVPDEIKNGDFVKGKTASADVIEVPTEEYSFLTSIFPALAGE